MAKDTTPKRPKRKKGEGCFNQVLAVSTLNIGLHIIMNSANASQKHSLARQKRNVCKHTKSGKPSKRENVLMK